MLKTTQLTKTFSRQDNDFDAVHSVDVEIGKGEICALTGPSGCGKSTFFHMICGITKPDAGQIIFDGTDVSNYNANQWAALRANDISYVLQGDSLLTNLTVLENICLPHQLTGSGDLKESAMALLKEFGLENMANDVPVNLSGGERRRVAIARAFVHGPKMVVADEPTSDLDEENTALILEFFKRQAKSGKTIIMSTHDLSVIDDSMTHLVMRKGVINKK